MMEGNKEELIALLNSMPKEDKEKAEECSKKIMALISEYGSNGLIALAVVGVSFEDI